MNLYHLLAIEILLNLISILTPITRFWILRKKKRSHNEWISETLFCIAVALTFTTVWGVCYKLILEIQLRERNPSGYMRIVLYSPKFLKMSYLFGISYIIELFALKGAFLAFYWGLFTGMDRRRKLLLPAAAAFVFLAFLSVFLPYLLWTRPIELNWSPDTLQVAKYAVFASFWFNTFGSWMNVGTDLIILGLPLLVISTLRLRRPEIFALIFIFTMGGMSLAATIARYFVLYPYIRKRPPVSSSTLHMFELTGTVEITAAIIAYCLPSFRVLYLKLLGSSNDTKQSLSGLPKHSGDRDGGELHSRQRRRFHTEETMWTIEGGENELESYGRPQSRAPYEGDAADRLGSSSPKIYVDRSFNVETETLRGGSPTQLKYPENSDQNTRLKRIQSAKSLIRPLPNPISKRLPASHMKVPSAVSSQERLKCGYVDRRNSNTNSDSDNMSLEERDFDRTMSQSTGGTKSDYSAKKDECFCEDSPKGG